jgi:hypothetical protein
MHGYAAACQIHLHGLDYLKSRRNNDAKN